ncbi:MAG: DNA polymerase III subunit gamma/tau [Bacteroidaceae bacterium]|nr:DNA polymerase III subunit gamma/tau [Bacteroidaceae bacterium]
MEYIVSARKYRPLTFDSVVGQSALTSTLKNSVKTGKLAHAYLFCGPRGVGKTTCARIFSKVINCMNPTAEGDACEECESCKAFNEQRSFNVFELDAASNNGVEQIKTLMEQTRIPPQIGKYKVFIIDEVHMLSTAAFNAFLKTLEEPPANVIFILATTEKHKLLPTIISRCQIYDFERMTVPNIINHLKMVADKEGIKYEEEALNVIAEKADGGMRDALSVFDQVASFCQGDITYEKVIQDLNVLDAETYFQIIDLSLQNNVYDIMLLVNQTLAKGFDGGQLVNGLAAHLRNVMMAKDERTVDMLQVSAQMKERFKQQAQKCSAPFLYRALRILNNCDVNYRASSNKRLLVELTLIEVAQITQPEVPGSGRKPYALKTLFKLFTNRKQSGQVSPADVKQVSVAAEKAKQTTETKQVKETAKPVETAARPVETNPKPQSPKAFNPTSPGGFSGGFSLKKLMSKTNTTVTEEKAEETVDENKSFTSDQLLFEWMAMCNRMPKEKVGLAMRLKNIIPTITTFPEIEVCLSNQMLYEETAVIRTRIQSTLRVKLQNKNISVVLRLAEKEEIKPLQTPLQRFNELKEKNDALRELFEGLGITTVS